MEGDAPLLQILDHLECVEGGAEQTIELGRDNHVALAQSSEQRARGKSLSDGNGATDAFLDHHAGERQPVHVGIAFDLASLNVKAFALGGLSDR
jgi:hypothetical protein